MKVCQQCGGSLKKAHQKKFCSHSCSAIFNNKGVRRNGSQPRDCLQCGCRLRRSDLTYCSIRCQQDHRRSQIFALIEKGEYLNTPGASRSYKNYLLSHRPHRCEICNTEKWMGKPVSLIMDHVDGNPENNSLENLRLICPNCDAQLPTFKARNKGNGRYFRRKRYSEGKSY